MFTQEQYDALLAAVATGTLEVQYSDKKVKYRSQEEMLSLLNLMANQLGIDTNSGAGRRVAEFNRG